MPVHTWNGNWGPGPVRTAMGMDGRQGVRAAWAKTKYTALALEGGWLSQKRTFQVADYSNARVDSAIASRKETYTGPRALFIINEVRTAKFEVKSAGGRIKAFFGVAIGGILTGTRPFELQDVAVSFSGEPDVDKVDSEVVMVPAFIVLSGNIQPCATDSHYSAVELVALAGCEGEGLKLECFYHDALKSPTFKTMEKANRKKNNYCKVVNYVAWMPVVSFLELCVPVPRGQLLDQYVLAWAPNTCSIDTMLVGLSLFKWDKAITTGGLTLLNGGEDAS